MRLFVGAPCPPGALRDLEQIVTSLPAGDWRRVPPHNRHLTLRFLGDQPDALITALVARLGPAVATMPAFDLELAGLGAFPNDRRPNVLWAGAGEGEAAFGLLVGAVDRVLTALGLPSAGEEPRVHLTLARRRSDADPTRVLRDWSERVARWRTTRWGWIRVNEVVVFRSELRPDGARYTPLARLELAAPVAGR